MPQTFVLPHEFTLFVSAFTASGAQPVSHLTLFTSILIGTPGRGVVTAVHILVTLGVHCRESRGSMWRNHMPPPPPRKNNQEIYNNTPRFPSAGRSQKGGRGRVDSASCNQEGSTDDDGADGLSDIEDNIEYAQGRGRSRSGMYWVFAV